MNWRQWLGLCESKGHKRETLEAGLEHRPGFSSAPLSKKSKRDADTRKLIRAVQTGGLVGGLAVLAAVVLVYRQHAPAVAPPAPNVTVNQGAAMGGAAFGFDLQSMLSAIATGEMGERMPPDKYIPDEQLPGQKLPPCDAMLYEEAINGGCWTPLLKVPPCGLLFRKGNICYRPIGANPQKVIPVIPHGSGI